MTGTTIDFNEHFKIEFGANAEAHKKNFPRNSTQSRIEPAICLVPTGNFQGSYWFLNLRTGLRIKQHTFTPLPFPTPVIERVQALADADD